MSKDKATDRQAKAGGGGLVTMADICDMLKLTAPTVRKLARRHRWDVIRFGRAVRYRLAQVLATVDALARQAR